MDRAKSQASLGLCHNPNEPNHSTSWLWMDVVLVQAYHCACVTRSRSVLGPMVGLRCASPDIASKYFRCSTLWVTASLFVCRMSGLASPNFTHGRSIPHWACVRWAAWVPQQFLRGSGSWASTNLHHLLETSAEKGREHYLAMRSISFPAWREAGQFSTSIKGFLKSLLSFIYIHL